MASIANCGLTARDAVLTYCTYWTQGAYLNCWPRLHEVAPDATTEEKKAACLAVARELRAMLMHEVLEQDDTASASASEPMRERAVLQITGDLDSDSEPAIKAGSFLGTYGKLDINTAGHWTYFAGETRLREIKENGPDWFAHFDRFFVTHEDGAVQTLTITLSRRRNDEVEKTKASPTVGDRVPAETFGENNEPDLRLATERDLRRKLPDPDQFDGPAPVPLWVSGQLGINQPLVWLAFDDIRIIEFDIEANETSGDGRKFVGLRFFNAAERLPVDEDSQPNDEAPETRKEKRARDTQEKYARWYSSAHDVRREGEWTRPTDIARAVAKREENATAGNVKRRLDEFFPGWATEELYQRPLAVTRYLGFQSNRDVRFSLSPRFGRERLR